MFRRSRNEWVFRGFLEVSVFSVSPTGPESEFIWRADDRTPKQAKKAHRPFSLIAIFCFDALAANLGA
jgi:hypothetical protein